MWKVRKLTISACPSLQSVWNLSCLSSVGRSLNPVYFTWNKRHNPYTYIYIFLVKLATRYNEWTYMNSTGKNENTIFFSTSHSLLNFLNSSSLSNEDLWSGTTLGIVLKLLFPTSQHNVFATNESMLSEVTSFITTSQQYCRCDEIQPTVPIGWRKYIHECSGSRRSPGTTLFGYCRLREFSVYAT